MNNVINMKKELMKKYEKRIADPSELEKLITENQQLITQLEEARERLVTMEESEEAKIEKTPTGKVWDEQKRGTITNEIRRFDPKLAEKISGERDKKKIVKTIDKRIKQVKKINKPFEKKLEALKERQRMTMAKGGALVEKILKKMIEIKELYEAEEKISKENERIRDEIKTRIKNKTVGVENIDQFVALSKKLEENNKKDAELRKKVAEHGKKLEELKEKATPIEEEFVKETEAIRGMRKKAA